MHLKAACYNIDHPMVCRVSIEGNGFSFSGKCLGNSVYDLNGTVTAGCPTNNRREPALDIPGASELLEDGDVLIVYPSGGCRILYRSSWFSNAIFLTNRCNNYCTCCPQPPKDDPDDLLGIALQMVRLIQDENPVLGITGGEPTCVWDKLVNAVAFTKEEIPGSYFHLLTNARALSNYEKASQLASVSQGDLLACVPLYADVPQLHDAITGVRGSFWEAIAGMKNLARVSVDVEIRVLVNRLTYTRLPEIAGFIYRNLPFATHIAFMGIELVGHAARHRQDLWVPPSKYIPYLEDAVQRLDRRDMQASIYNHPLCVVPKRLHRHLSNSISEWKVSFPTMCNGCLRQEECPGFFPSVAREMSSEIKPYLP